MGLLLIRRLIITVSLIPLILNQSLSQQYSIEVTVPGYAEEEIYLAFFLAENQYVKDTARKVGQTFRFSDDKSIAPGFYLLVFPPDNIYMQILIPDSNNVDIAISADTSDLTKPGTISGSSDTEMFYDYARFISSRRPEADRLRRAIEEAESEPEKARLTEELERMNAEVESQQQKILSAHPNSLTAMLIKANLEVNVPDFEGDDANEQVYTYYKQHYFDNIDLSDPRIVRTPFFQDRIDYYIDKLTYQQPDSLIWSIDRILRDMDESSEAFQVVLVGFLNTYATSKVVGMDAVYVHLADTYYATGKASWTGEEQLRKIMDNANTLRPILIGKKAPNLTLLDREKNPVILHDIDAEYTVMYFWDPECGHCKKSIPKVIEFYEAYREKGVEVLAICTKLGESEKSCWEAIDDRGMDIWMNASDPYLKSRFKQLYDVKTTPQIYILDSDDNIIMKKIGAEQLPKVMDHFLNSKSDETNSILKG